MIMVAATSKKALTTQLLKMGLLIEGEDGPHPAKRVLVSGFGGVAEPVVWSSKPEYNEDGEIVKEGVKHKMYHANILARHLDLSEAVVEDGETVSGVDWGKVKLIDPDKVKTPALTFA